MRIALLCLLLSGCSSMLGAIPSLQHCERVSYERIGKHVSIAAECTAPIGGALAI
jgi:hypothetical protein